jgi:hypothetical protein
VAAKELAMKYQHYDLGNLNGGEIVEVTLSGTEANVCLMDDLNFCSYEAGRSFRHVGGHYKRSPVRLAVPKRGHWHVTVDLGGFGGSVSSSVRVVGGG